MAGASKASPMATHFFTFYILNFYFHTRVGQVYFYMAILRHGATLVANNLVGEKESLGRGGGIFWILMV